MEYGLHFEFLLLSSSLSNGKSNQIVYMKEMIKEKLITLKLIALH